MRPREALDGMLWRLATDMPDLLKDRDSFFRKFEDRACFILSEASPEDEPYVQSVLDAFIAQAGINEWLPPAPGSPGSPGKN